MSIAKTATIEQAKALGLTEEEWRIAHDALGRVPNYVELSVLSVMWSEHCSYKSSRVHLKRLPTEGSQVVLGPGENAGAVDIGDGYCAVFKMESHNHPSFIEPYQGAATGVGGILRDVFTMGARPIASLNSLRFGQIDHPKTPHLVRGVVAGIGGYGNAIGVPTVGGEVQFDASYNGNILVNAFTLGIARSEDLFFGVAEGVGNPVLYVGAKTGRDGIHGATMASAEFDADSQAKLPTVQVGDPFMEKLLLEACLEIFDAGCLSGVQDMGAAGLTSSSVEMAARAGNGLELNLDQIPRRARAMLPEELLLSESQERMLMVAKDGREDEVLAICRKWDLDAAVIGTVTDTGKFVCKATPGFDPLTSDPSAADPRIVCELDVGLLTDSAPKYDRAQRKKERPSSSLDHVLPDKLWPTLKKLIASPNLCSRAPVFQQYDHVVGVGTIVRPGQANAAVVLAFPNDKDLRGQAVARVAMTVQCNGRYVELDARVGAAMAVAECALNIACVGAKPLAITDCLNFGSPEVPETMWQFSQAIDGIADACEELNMPVVSGNVSLYNETDGSAILPTPSVAAVGKFEADHPAVTMDFKDAGDLIYLVGAYDAVYDLGGSEWLTQEKGSVCGTLPGLDLAAHRRLISALRAAAEKEMLKSARTISGGGLGISLVKSVFGGDLAFDVMTPEVKKRERASFYLNENPSRALVSTSPVHAQACESMLSKERVPFIALGKVCTGDRLSIDGEQFSRNVLCRASNRGLETIFG